MNEHLLHLYMGYNRQTAILCKTFLQVLMLPQTIMGNIFSIVLGGKWTVPVSLQLSPAIDIT